MSKYDEIINIEHFSANKENNQTFEDFIKKSNSFNSYFIIILFILFIIIIIIIATKLGLAKTNFSFTSLSGMFFIFFSSI